MQGLPGLRDGVISAPDAKKQKALQTGVLGETYAYWYLRRLGYLFIAKNYAPSHSEGESTSSDTTETRWSSSKSAPAPQ